MRVLPFVVLAALLIHPAAHRPAAAQRPPNCAVPLAPPSIAWDPDHRQRLPLLPAHLRLEHRRALLAGGRPLWVAIRVPKRSRALLPHLGGEMLEAKAAHLGFEEVTLVWVQNPRCGLWRCKAVARAVAPTPEGPPRSRP